MAKRYLGAWVVRLGIGRGYARDSFLIAVAERLAVDGYLIAGAGVLQCRGPLIVDRH
jgi:hypothetical protein